MKKSNGLGTTFKGLTPWMLAVVAVVSCDYFFSDLIGPYPFSIIMFAGINIVLAVSLNLVNGFTGQFSMGHAGFMAVGAYVSGAITTVLVSESHPQLLEGVMGNFVFAGALLAGGLAAAIVGYIVGLPSLRLRGDYLAIVTLGFGEIIRVVFLNIEVTGGARGLAGIPLLANLSWVYVIVILTVFCISRVVSSAHGRALLSVREDEIAAESMGVNTTQAKVRAFVLGSFFAGLAGGLFAHNFQYINPQVFDFNRSFEVIIMVVLGGMGSISGSILSAVFLTVLRELLRSLQEITQVDYRMIIYSLILIIMMLTRPNGLFGTKEVWEYLPGFKKRKESNVPPAEGATP